MRKHDAALLQKTADSLMSLFDNPDELDMMTLSDSFINAYYTYSRHLPLERKLMFSISDGNKVFEMCIEVDADCKQIVSVRVENE